MLHNFVLIVVHDVQLVQDSVDGAHNNLSSVLHQPHLFHIVLHDFIQNLVPVRGVCHGDRERKKHGCLRHWKENAAKDDCGQKKCRCPLEHAVLGDEFAVVCFEDFGHAAFRSVHVENELFAGDVPDVLVFVSV